MSERERDSKREREREEETEREGERGREGRREREKLYRARDQRRYCYMLFPQYRILYQYLYPPRRSENPQNQMYT